MLSTAKKIVEFIIEDIKSRKGLRETWDDIDFDIRHEIEENWVGAIQLILAVAK